MNSDPKAVKPAVWSIRRRQMMKLLVALLLATSAEGLNTKQQVALKKPLVLRGGALGAKTALLVQTAGLTAFGSEFILSKWASTRYWDDASPTAGWKQLSEAFGIGLLCLAHLTYSQAQTGDATSMAAHGKTLAYAWIAWTLMHVKWLVEGTLISSGPFKGQVGGWIPCTILAAIGITTFLM